MPLWGLIPECHPFDSGSQAKGEPEGLGNGRYSQEETGKVSGRGLICKSRGTRRRAAVGMRGRQRRGLTLCIRRTRRPMVLLASRVRHILHRRRDGQSRPGLILLVWVEGVHLLPCLMAPDLAGVPPTGCPNLIQPPTNCLSLEQAAAPRPRAGWLEQSSGHLRLPTAQLSLPLHAHVVLTMWLEPAPTPASLVQQAWLAPVSTETLPFLGLDADQPGGWWVVCVGLRLSRPCSTQSSNCCWLQKPLSSHAFWQGTVS